MEANMAIINGRRIYVPESGMSGRDIIKEANPGSNRRTVVHRGLNFETIEPNRLYSKEALISKKTGQPLKISTIPDRTKGLTYGGNRSALSKQIITEQVISLAEHCFKPGLDFDEANADWMIVRKYVLPAIWHDVAETSPLLIIFPTEYPEIPPVGFYLKASLSQSPNGHLYAQAYHEACKDPLEEGWKWYCVYVNAGAWQPARYRQPGDWQRGDNLWQYFRLITEALASRDE
jgi:hypothetical protein